MGLATTMVTVLFFSVFCISEQWRRQTWAAQWEPPGACAVQHEAQGGEQGQDWEPQSSRPGLEEDREAHGLRSASVLVRLLDFSFLGFTGALMAPKGWDQTALFVFFLLK